jgi:hypothetical protein
MIDTKYINQKEVFHHILLVHGSARIHNKANGFKSTPGIVLLLYDGKKKTSFLPSHDKSCSTGTHPNPHRCLISLICNGRTQVQTSWRYHVQSRGGLQAFPLNEV